MARKKESQNKGIPSDRRMSEALRRLTDDLRFFIELSLSENDGSWEDWLRHIMKNLQVKCWEVKACGKKSCPAFQNPSVRCWLAAGTLCGGGAQGTFALKYRSCTECDVYRKSVFDSPITEIYEHVITLVHNLKTSQDRLKAMAVRDPLTGLYNRHYFNETISREIERARRHRENVSFIMIDVDRFKYFNDTYGHVHGDGILRECAAILRRAVRKSDILCRFGGDEFLIVTPSRDCGGNEPIIARIRKYVAEWNRKYGSDDYELSLSMGCSILEKNLDLLDALHEADKAMYENKKGKKTD